jgi:hypothetical protein
MTQLRRIIAVFGTATLVITGLGLFSGSSVIAQPLDHRQLNMIQRRIASGALATELNGADPAAATPPSAQQAAAGTAACVNQFGPNVKVNQNCLNLTDADLSGRGQAQNETSMAIDPANAHHLVASYNDYRRGDTNCGTSYSLDGGASWADATVPDGFTRGGAFGGKARQFWQVASDSSVAWDSRGNVYLSCLVFNRGAGTTPSPDRSRAIYVYRSTASNGASWNFAGRPVVEGSDTTGAGAAIPDRPLLTVDNSTSSAYRDRVYVAWTEFALDGTGYLYAAHSADYGQTFSAPVLVSGTSTLCDNTFGVPTPNGTCNENQAAQPFTAPDGTLYVAFNNFNNTVTGGENRNQVLLARSTDGGASFSAPVLVGFFNDLPDCATYQNGADPFAACVPEQGSSTNSIFRANSYPTGSVNPTAPNTVVVAYGSYINRHSNESTGCTPAGFAADFQTLYTGVKTGACNNDIVLSVSTNAGISFTGTTTDVRQLAVVTNAPRQARADQFSQAATFAPNGTLAVSYYDRQYGQDNSTGFSDITVSSTNNLTSFQHARATSTSMPPPTQFAGTFYGDYAGIAVTNSTAYPLWSDTRPVALFLCPGTATNNTPPGLCQAAAPNATLANDQDIYTTAVPLT